MSHDFTFNIFSVVPGQGETVAGAMRVEALDLHKSEATKALNRVDLPLLVHPST